MANRRGRGSGGGTKAKDRADTAPPSEVGTHVVDLNSRSATHIASIVFYPVQLHNLDIILFEVHDCLLVCQHFSHWLQNAGTPDIREAVRIDDIELNLIAPNTKGTLFFLENAATLEGVPSAPVSIFALHVPKDKHVRFLWTPLSPSLLLTELAIQGLIGPPIIFADQFKPTFSPTGAFVPPYHHTVYTIIAQCFEDATKYPDSPAMIKATRISDVCPSIRDPATAHQRIDAADTLHSSHDPNDIGKDLSDDRYIHEIHPAERQLASLLKVGCAEYLFIKRTYFKAFSRETVLHAAKVRRAAAHMRNSNRAAGTQQVQVKEEDEEDEGDEGDADDDKENNKPPADVLSAPIPRATPLTTLSRTHARQAADQQVVSQAAPDDKQNDEVSAADSLKPEAAHLVAGSRTRSQRASDQQNVIQAVPLAGAEQMDVTMKDTEDDDEKQSVDLPADAPNPRVVRLRVRTRGSTATPVANPVVHSMAAQNLVQAAPLPSIEQNDIEMEDKEDETDGNEKSDDPPADAPDPRAARAGALTRRSDANSATSSIATQNVSAAIPTAGAEQDDTLMKDKRKKNSPAGSASPKAKRPRGRPPKQQSAANSVDPKAAPAVPRPRGRPRGSTRQSTTNSVATDDDKTNDDSSAGSPIPTIPKAAPLAAGRRTRRSAADSLARVATPAETPDAEDEDEHEDDNQSNDSPAPTESTTNRETPAATRSGAGRPRHPPTQLAVARSSAAHVGARNRALRVRTTNKHIRTLEEQAGFMYRLASKWILGWDILGFLDEERVLAVQEGKDNDGESEWSE
jgi:hypothetical protein